jgi:hypothetical protein
LLISLPAQGARLGRFIQILQATTLLPAQGALEDKSEVEQLWQDSLSLQ